VVFTGFGENSIDFKLLTWVDSRKAIYAKSDIMETAYNALNEHGIEIPFPQCDIHIIHDHDIKGNDAPVKTEKEE
jgi:small-conductance mechanosensitive channel